MNALETTTTAACSGSHLEKWFEFLTAYCKGWSKGDVEMIRAVVADDFVWDDPTEDRVTKDGLDAFLPRFKEKIDRLRDAASPSASYLTRSSWVVDRNKPIMTVWCGFAVPGTDIYGTAQIRVGNEGVISEHRAYRRDPPTRVAGVRGRGR